MINNGAKRNVFYCPSNKEFNNDLTWYFPGSDPATQGPFRITGFVWFLKGLQGGVPTKYWRDSLLGDSTNSPSSSEFTVDVVISYGTPPNYANVPIGGLPSTVRQRTSHLINSAPAGGNIEFLDGHVEWRPFKRMTNYFGGGATPKFEF
jgi:hypothetical protein